MWPPDFSGLKRILSDKAVCILEKRCFANRLCHTLYNKWASNGKCCLSRQVTWKSRGPVVQWSDVTGAVVQRKDEHRLTATFFVFPYFVFPYFQPSKNNYPSRVLHPLPPPTSASRNLTYRVIDTWRLKPTQSYQTTMKRSKRLNREEVGVKGVGPPAQSAPFCCDIYSNFSALAMGSTEEGVFYSFLTQFH